MSHVRIKSIVVSDDVFDEYDLSPFSAKSPLGVPIKLLFGLFVLLHFFAGLFYYKEDGRFENWADEHGKGAKVFYWLVKIPLLILGYGFGIILIPIQIITAPFVLIYVSWSKEKEKNDDRYW